VPGVCCSGGLLVPLCVGVLTQQMVAAPPAVMYMCEAKTRRRLVVLVPDTIRGCPPPPPQLTTTRENQVLGQFRCRVAAMCCGMESSLLEYL
jgi:hypothetical protein